MRIKRLKLVNFIGIYSGTGKYEIEINFPDNGKKITMLRGGNGSGKTTILSQLTPFKDAFDENRKTLILPGKEGIKEIDIEFEGNLYNIKHVYGKTTSSFIKENGVELNENGGVRTFEDIIKTKFKLTKEYFKIGKIGSNTSSFIKLSTTNRKAYISTFIEAVQKYIDAYDIVSKKSKLNKKQAEQIGKDLAKYDGKEEVVKNIEKSTENIAKYDADINELTTTISDLRSAISSINSDLSKLDYYSAKSILAEKKKSINKNYIINENFNKVYPDLTKSQLEEMIAATEKELTQLNLENTENETKLTSELTNKVNADNEIVKTKLQIKTDNGEKLKKLSEELKILNKEKDDLDNYFKNNKYADLLKDNYPQLPDFISSFKDFLLTICNNYSILNTKTIDSSKCNVDLFFGPDFSNTFTRYVQLVNTSLTNNRTNLEKRQTEYGTKNANLGQLEILNKRPNECSIDSCPFIANALKYKNLPQELVELENIIKGIQSSITSNEKILDDLSDIRVTYSEIAKSFKKLHKKENLVFSRFIANYGQITEFSKIGLINLQKAYNEIAEEAEDIQNKIERYNVIKNDIEVKTVSFTNISESEKTRSYFQDELTKLLLKKDELSNIITGLTNTKTKLSSELQTKQNLLKQYNDYLTSLTETSDLENEVTHLTEQISVYDAQINKKKDLDKRLLDKSKQLSTCKANKTTEESNLVNYKVIEKTITSLTENLNELTKSFADIELVEKALNPKSGIPLIFIKSYLDGAESIANDLLNIVYHGKFEIKFAPTSSDFFINVRKDDNVISDILSASQGEVALTTISISLALIERSLGQYNIICLDEIDGELDNENREQFINILNKQITKLGIEQVFVISHNSSFDACNMNLILMPRNDIDTTNIDFMSNKEIIYNAAD